MRDARRRFLAEDAVDRSRLRAHRQYAPPATRVRKCRGPPEKRVQRRDLQPYELVHDFEHVRSPGSRDVYVNAVGSLVKVFDVFDVRKNKLVLENC